MIRNTIKFINPYDPGKFPSDIAKKYGFKESKVIQLASNENPFPPSKKVKEEYERAFSKINRYPHPEYPELKAALAEYTGVDRDRIAIGNGAGEVLKTICEVVLDTFDTVTIPVPGYTLHAIFAMLRDANINFIEFPGYRINADKILEKPSKLLFLCSPNNPVGNAVPKKELIKILENYSGLVVVDEAYAEFSGKTALDLIDEFENLVVVRSLSKFFGLAGMRVGYAIGNAELIEAIEKIRLPFCISEVACRTAIAALQSLDYYNEIKEKIIKERERLVNELKKIKFLEVYPSEANFVLVKVKQDIDVANELEKKGIIVRNVTGLLGLEGVHIRITVGTEEENNQLINALKELS